MEESKFRSTMVGLNVTDNTEISLAYFIYQALQKINSSFQLEMNQFPDHDTYHVAMSVILSLEVNGQWKSKDLGDLVVTDKHIRLTKAGHADILRAVVMNAAVQVGRMTYTLATTGPGEKPPLTVYAGYINALITPKSGLDSDVERNQWRYNSFNNYASLFATFAGSLVMHLSNVVTYPGAGDVGFVDADSLLPSDEELTLEIFRVRGSVQSLKQLGVSFYPGAPSADALYRAWDLRLLRKPEAQTEPHLNEAEAKGDLNE